MSPEESIFAAALAVGPGGDRDAYLDAACGGDAGLRRAVGALLLAHARASGILEAPPAGLDATVDDDSAPPGHGVGSTVGRYKLLERIGEGGMGTVYMAEQTRPVRRRVALKLIKPGMDSGQVVARFEAERQALAMMDHENIAKVLDAGATDAGRPYFVMELVPGVPVTAYCDRHKLATRDRLGLFVQVCRAVQHAHGKGVIHRDLKPSNVLVTVRDDRAVPKVIDFGVAKAAGHQLTDRTLFTQFAQMVGTPLYMSPEQAQMGGVDVDTRSDVYSLGVLLYELLTGTTPFDRQRLGRAALDEVRRIIREEEPPRPSTRLSTAAAAVPAPDAGRGQELRRLSGVVRGELDWVVMRCLEKDRGRRYETAAGLAKDVERYLADEPVQARPTSAGYRLRKFGSRHRAAVAAGLAVTAALLLGLGGTVAGLVRARAASATAAAAEADATRQRDAALGLLGQVRAAKADADRQAARAGSAYAYLQSMFRAVEPPGRGGGGSDVRLVDVLRKAGARLDELRDQPEAELDLRLTLAGAYDALALHHESAEHHDRALALSRAAAGPEAEPTLRVTADALLAKARSGGRDGVELMAGDAAATARRVLGPDHPVVLDTLEAQGLLLANSGKHADAERVFRDLVRRTGDGGASPGPKGRARFHNNLALAVKAQGRGAEAEDLQRVAVRVAAAEREVEARRPGPARRNFAMTLLRRGRLDEAERLLAEALEDERAALGPLHQETGATADSLAAVYERRGKYAHALALRREQLARTAAAGAASWRFPSRYAVAELLLRTGDERAAWAAFAGVHADSAMADAGEKGDGSHARYAWVRANLMCGARADRPWAGAALRAHALDALDASLEARAWGDPALDAVDWPALRFRVVRWSGDPAAGAAGATPGRGPPGAGPAVAEGDLARLWATPDPPDGVYLLSFSVPRRGGRPITGATWVWAARWRVDLYPEPEGPDAPAPDDDDRWARLFTGDPAERHEVPAVLFERFGMSVPGRGPGRGLDDGAVTAQATVALPRGKYRLHVATDLFCRGMLDGRPLFGPSGGWAVPVTEIDATDGKPGVLRVDFDSSSTLVVKIEPVGGAAAAVWAAAQDPMAVLEATAERLAARVAAGPPSGRAFYDRGATFARLGRFPEAKADWDRTLELSPLLEPCAFVQTCLLAYLGEADAHRALARAEVRRCRGLADPQAWERAAKACLVLPGAAEDGEELMARTAEAVAAGGPHVAWSHMAHGMAAHRAGPAHDAAAVAALGLAVAGLADDGAWHARAACLYFRAMALGRLGRGAEARAAFDAAEAVVRASGTVAGKDDLGVGGVENWFVCQAVRREAGQAFGAVAATGPAATAPAPAH